MNDVTIIDRFLDTFSRYIDSGFGLLHGEVAFLTATLIARDRSGAYRYLPKSVETFLDLGVGRLHQLGQLLGLLHVVVQPQRERVFHHARDKPGNGARRKSLFRLAGKLWVKHFHRKHEGSTFPQIIGGELDATGQQTAVFTEFSQGV